MRDGGIGSGFLRMQWREGDAANRQTEAELTCEFSVRTLFGGLNHHGSSS